MISVEQAIKELAQAREFMGQRSTMADPARRERLMSGLAWLLFNVPEHLSPAVEAHIIDLERRSLWMALKGEGGGK